MNHQPENMDGIANVEAVCIFLVFLTITCGDWFLTAATNYIVSLWGF